MSNPDGADHVGWSNNNVGNYMNTYLGTFDGPGNPNTTFNPNIGTYSTAGTFDHGGTGANLVSYKANVLPGQDYSVWNWEEILNQILGTTMPDRAQILQGRWTGMLNHSAGSNNYFYIYGVTWGAGGDSSQETYDDSLIYLNPALLTKGGPWDIFLNTPYSALWDSSKGFDPSKFLDLQPQSFQAPALALQAVEMMYLNSLDTLGTLSSALNTDGSQFQGKAGGAFYQLINNLRKHVSSVAETMGIPNWPGSYDYDVNAAGEAAAAFLKSIWNSYAAWTNLMEHSPLGAILRSMINHGVVTQDANGKYEANPNLDPNYSSYVPPSLTTDGAWLAVEADAKNLWTAAVTNVLDYNAGQAFNELIDAYEIVVKKLQPLRLRPLPAITTGNSSPNPNSGGSGGGLNTLAGGMNKEFGAMANMMANMDKNMANMMANMDKNMFNFMDKGFSQIPNLGHSIFGGLNGLYGGLGNLGKNVDGGFNGLGGGLNGLYGGLGNLGKNVDGGFNGVGGGLGDLGKDVGGGFNGVGGGLGDLGKDVGGGFNGLGSGLSGLGNQKAYESTGPLNSYLGQAQSTEAPLLTPTSQLANNLTPTSITPAELASTGSGLTTPTGDLGSVSEPETSDLENALAGTNQTQAALDQALASGDVPASGPLATALNGALADNGQTQSAIEQALASGNPSTAALQTALADNGKTQTALNQALASGEVPSTGPLASDLGTALAGTSRTQAALGQALPGGGTSASSLHSALTDNSQTQAALDKALSSGQVPATGALHTAVQSALADSGKTQAALTRALATSSPSATQLRTAMADNDATRAALQKALASGQVPKTGALHNALTTALADTGKTNTALHQAMLASTPGGASLNRAMTSDTALQSALHRAVASGQVPKVGQLHDAVQSALEDGSKVQNALKQAMAGGGTASTAAISRALTDNQALQGALHKALASGQIPKTGALHTDLENALSDSQRTGAALHQALASRGVTTEPGASVLSGGGAGSLTSGLSVVGNKPLVSPASATAGGTGQVSLGGTAGAGGGLGTSGLATSATPASSGRFTAPTTTSGAAGTAASTDSELPMMMPGMGMGGMGMGGMGGANGQSQERERTTWLAEDEDVWGTEPDVAPQVLGRDFGDEDDEASEYADADREARDARRTQARLYGR
jgi:hypothetical protein